MNLFLGHLNLSLSTESIMLMYQRALQSFVPSLFRILPACRSFEQRLDFSTPQFAPLFNFLIFLSEEKFLANFRFSFFFHLKMFFKNGFAEYLRLKVAFRILFIYLLEVLCIEFYLQSVCEHV